jgi:hypothetical protein
MTLRPDLFPTNITKSSSNVSPFKLNKSGLLLRKYGSSPSFGQRHGTNRVDLEHKTVVRTTLSLYILYQVIVQMSGGGDDKKTEGYDVS